MVDSPKNIFEDKRKSRKKQMEQILAELDKHPYIKQAFENYENVKRVHIESYGLPQTNYHLTTQVCSICFTKYLGALPICAEDREIYEAFINGQ